MVKGRMAVGGELWWRSRRFGRGVTALELQDKR